MCRWLAGFLTRLWGERTRGVEWYETRFLPRIAPWALWGLLFTVVVLFALQGETITAKPLDVAGSPCRCWCTSRLMWAVSFALGMRLGIGYPRNTTLAFTAASNNFELAIAVAIGVYGVTSGQALAGVVGPLIEVPVLVGLVYVALWARRRFYPAPAESARLDLPCPACSGSASAACRPTTSRTTPSSTAWPRPATAPTNWPSSRGSPGRRTAARRSGSWRPNGTSGSRSTLPTSPSSPARTPRRRSTPGRRWNTP